METTYFTELTHQTPHPPPPGLDPTNKKSQIRIFFWKNLKILEASSYDQINMTEFWLEHDQKILQRRMNRQSINKKINKTINNRT